MFGSIITMPRMSRKQGILEFLQTTVQYGDKNLDPPLRSQECDLGTSRSTKILSSTEHLLALPVTLTTALHLLVIDSRRLLK